MSKVATFEAMTRMGFAARGLVYIIIGYLTLRTGHAADNADALGYLQSATGNFLMYGMALGFLAYGAWRLFEAWFDTEGHGPAWKGVAVRSGGAISGIIHVALSVSCVGLAIGTRRPPTSENAAAEGAATALSMPAGETVLTAVALAIGAIGTYQVIRAVKGDFLRHIDQTIARTDWALWTGRAGYAARGVVFIVVAILSSQAARTADPTRAGGIGEAVASFPITFRLVVALGLLLFGLYSLIEARYRRINDPHVLSRLRVTAGAIGR